MERASARFWRGGKALALANSTLKSVADVEFKEDRVISGASSEWDAPLKTQRPDGGKPAHPKASAHKEAERQEGIASVLEDQFVVVVGVSGIKEDNPFESNTRDDGDLQFGVKDQLFVAAPVEFVQFEGAIGLSGDSAGGSDRKGSEATDGVDPAEAVAFKRWNA